MSKGELPPLDPELRALIDAAQDVHDPAPVQRAQTFAGLEAKIAAGAVGTAAAVGWASRVKAAVAVLGVGALALAALWGTHVETPRPRETATHAPTHQDRPASAARTAPAPTSEHEERAAAVARDEGARPTRNKERALPSLDGETDLLRAANGALNRGDGARALKLLAQYDRRFPVGALREERSATEVMALCADGRSVEAQALARSFIARYPRSPLIARVTGACGADAATKGVP